MIILVLIGIILWIYFGTKTKRKDYVTVDITRGDIVQTVTATGEIMPVNTVNVGSQVSGTIEDIFVDYNSRVKKGDLLLTIEPSVLQSTVDEAKASLDSAKSELKYAQSEFKRNETLYRNRFGDDKQRNLFL